MRKITDTEVAHILAIAKKAAEYGRSGRWNESLDIALQQVDNALVWSDEANSSEDIMLSENKPIIHKLRKSR